ncbi:hypothetical protein CBS147343_2261 [Aspergillus niger]|nr:hypothetical protein CBS12448_932 [Aspergillus niger]KAI2911787.1 hypothetical protein CBS147371_7848 [Aspergillus niger]KAI2985244.1 hypothetical protein CBS147344_6382 [Aspergillus niger]KAI3040372.1 hypothetical protein CBS147352_9944 [Aspergillus niger]KAI3087394.1 hypothetical protein CBS147343_2261 [Aspergillus niger]
MQGLIGSQSIPTLHTGNLTLNPLRLSEEEEDSIDSENTTVHKYHYNHRYSNNSSSSSSSSPTNHPPDIEKCQPYRGYRQHDDDDDDDDTDILSNPSGDNSINSNGRPKSRVVMLYAACYVAFAILSFFSATYYFLCWMPYEPSNSNPFPGRHR